MATRTRVEVHYDTDAGDWEKAADRLGTLIVHEERGASIHEQLRGIPVVVRVDVPQSYTDRYWRRAVLYMSPDTLRKEYGADNAETRATALRVLTDEARECRAWWDGYVFGVVEISEHTCPDCDQWHETDRDGIWGFCDENPGRDLMDAGEHLSEHGRAALALALHDGWTGSYPVAARATIG